MSDWSDKPSALGALLDEARGDGPSPERLERVRARLEHELGASLAPAPARDAAATPAGATTSPSGSTVLAGVAVAGALAVALWLLAPGTPSPPPLVASPAVPPAAAAETAATEPPAAPAASAPTTAADLAADRATEPERAEIAAPEPGAPSAEPTRARRGALEAVPRTELPGLEPSEGAPGSTLREEIALLEQAMAARDAGDLDGARSTLALHRARFPEGILSPERDRLLGELGP